MRRDWWFGRLHVIRYHVVGGERYYGWQLSLPRRERKCLDVFWGRRVFVFLWAAKWELV